MINRNTFFKSSVFFTNILFPGIGGMEMHQFEIMKKVKYIFTRDGGFSLYRKHHLEINTESFAEIVRVLHELIEQEHIQFFIFNNLSCELLSIMLFLSLKFLFNSSILISNTVLTFETL